MRLELIMDRSDRKYVAQSALPASQSGQFIVESHEDSKQPPDLQK